MEREVNDNDLLAEFGLPLPACFSLSLARPPYMPAMQLPCGAPEGEDASPMPHAPCPRYYAPHVPL